jgi:hypothetical protein
MHQTALGAFRSAAGDALSLDGQDFIMKIVPRNQRELEPHEG